MSYLFAISVALILLSSRQAFTQEFYPSTVLKNSYAQFGPTTDPFVTATNPAVMSETERFSAGIYTEKKFLLKELMIVGFAARGKLDNNWVSLSAFHFGGASYNERQVGLGVGRSLGKMSIGMHVAVFSTRINNRQVLSTVQTIVASIWKIHPDVYSSVRIRNIDRLFFAGSKNQYQVAAAFNAGVGYNSSKTVYVGMEFEKESNRSFEVIGILRFEVSEHYFFKGTWNSATHQPRVSAGWLAKKIHVEAGVEYHMVLGITPSVAMYINKQVSE